MIFDSTVHIINIPMGSITSKQNPEALKNIKNGSNDVVSQNVTPKPVKTLPFDPRSPSEYINRTPITVSDYIILISRGLFNQLGD